MLRLEQVSTYYGGAQALYGVSLEVPEGAVVALLGRNGMGKSTVVHSIIGFTPPREGQVIFKGEAVQKRKPNEIAQAGIALVPQGKRIFPSLSVHENLTVGAQQRKGRQNWTTQEMYTLFPVLEKRARFRGTLLSGGEQQILAVARALMTAPDLVLMDEPSEGLAPLLVAHLGEIIKKLKAKGLSVLLVEQNLNFALSVADIVYILNRGEIVCRCTPDELRMNEEIKTRFLGVSV